MLSMASCSGRSKGRFFLISRCRVAVIGNSLGAGYRIIYMSTIAGKAQVPAASEGRFLTLFVRWASELFCPVLGWPRWIGQQKEQVGRIRGNGRRGAR